MSPITAAAIVGPGLYLLIVLRLQVWLEISQLWEGGDAWAYALFWPICITVHITAMVLWFSLLRPVGLSTVWTYERLRGREKRRVADHARKMREDALPKAKVVRK